MYRRIVLLSGGILSLAYLAPANAAGSPLFQQTANTSKPKPVIESRDSAAQPQKPGRFFRLQYHKPGLSFCNSPVCVDFYGSGRREILFASRKTEELQMLNADDGRVVWSRKLAGDQQSIMAYDLDADGDFEILYSVSSPGRLYVLDNTGKVLRQWDSGDSKLGNSAVIVDADGDGQLDPQMQLSLGARLTTRPPATPIRCLLVHCE